MPAPPPTTNASIWLEALTAGVRPVRCPDHGWLRAVREALGLSRRAVAEELQVSQAAVRDFELAEATDAITLRTLRRTAHALDCELVLALVPANKRSFTELAAAHPRPSTPAHARAIEATATPPSDQETGDIDMHLR